MWHCFLLAWRRIDGVLRKANIDEAMIPYLSPGARAFSRIMTIPDLDPQFFSNAIDDHQDKALLPSPPLELPSLYQLGLNNVLSRSLK